MIFVDTWAWISLADKSDPYHRKAKAEHKKLRRAQGSYVNTDYVLSETIRARHRCGGCHHGLDIGASAACRARRSWSQPPLQ